MSKKIVSILLAVFLAVVATLVGCGQSVEIPSDYTLTVKNASQSVTLDSQQLSKLKQHSVSITTTKTIDDVTETTVYTIVGIRFEDIFSMAGLDFANAGNFKLHSGDFNKPTKSTANWYIALTGTMSKDGQAVENMSEEDFPRAISSNNQDTSTGVWVKNIDTIELSD